MPASIDPDMEGDRLFALIQGMSFQSIVDPKRWSPGTCAGSSTPERGSGTTTTGSAEGAGSNVSGDALGRATCTNVAAPPWM